MTRPTLRMLIPLAAVLSGALAPSAAPARPLAKPTWLKGVSVTEYFPVPEKWFAGRRVAAPGLRGTHRIDWLYSATGISMEGDGVGLDGHRYHIEELGAGGWVNARGHRTAPTRRASSWTHGQPVWRAGGYWRSRAGFVTFPFEAGGWSHGAGTSFLRPPAGIGFAAGPSLPLTYWHSVAVDPRLIPLGSRVYIPAYKGHGGGWFRAADTGGAIIGRHLDVYRPAPATPDGGSYLTGQRVYVVPGGQRP